ncbi:MAG: LysR family transcriptional regulator [SAR324 cluster bacterium]|nr:LysR family transcriptional regulator [SAR324 cluster bacterium]
MTLDQLKMLTKIVENGSVLAAAKALYRTQPTVSVAIKKLEEELNVTILARDQYRASLTPEGEKLYQKAKVILRHAEGLENLAHMMAVGNEPEIRIAIEVSCPMPLVLKIMKKCEKQFPHTQFNLMVENVSGAMERLIENDVDIAICPWLEENQKLESFVFANAKLINVVSPEFPLASYQKEIYLEDLSEYVQVIVRDSSRNPSEKSFGVLEGGRHWLVNNQFTKKEIILAGMGWGRLHHHLIDNELKEGRLIPLMIKNYQNTVPIEMRVVRKLDQPIGPIASKVWNNFQKISM